MSLKQEHDISNNCCQSRNCPRKVILILRLKFTNSFLDASGSFSLVDLLPKEHISGRNEEAAHARVKRAYQAYYYNYLDEMAMSICAAVQQYAGQIYAVRRTPGEASTCKDICTNDELRNQGLAGF